MKIVLATGNKGKIKEFKYMMPNDDVIAYTDLIEEFDIVEDGLTFQENALIKARAISKKINNINLEEYIIISDDSGITVPALNNEPGIYSARYAGINATDKDNLNREKDSILVTNNELLSKVNKLEEDNKLVHELMTRNLELQKQLEK